MSERGATVELKDGRIVVVEYVREDNSWWGEIILPNGKRIPKKHEATAWVEYMPLALGYAATVHKAQGLTLASVQICTDKLLSGKYYPGIPGDALLYVALSRCKSSKDVFLTGTVSLSQACRMSPEVAEWI
jgi:ATP-dependent exoDNAse (exonuclease V) alpha subunit